MATGTNLRTYFNGTWHEGDDGRRIVGARPVSVFLVPALDKGLDGHSLADVERADAFGPVYLVGGQGQIIHVEIRNNFV